MATCGSTVMWCALAFIAVFASFGASQTSVSPPIQTPDNCTGYNPSAPCNAPPEVSDKLYCLNNGSTFRFCDAQQTVCQHRATLEKDASVCESTTKSSSTTPRFPLHPNGASRASSTPSNEHEPSINTGGFNGLNSGNKGENTAASLQKSCHILLASGFLAITFFSGLQSLF